MRFRESTGNKWTFAADRGGTFTDILGIDSKGRIHQEKILSESEFYEDSVLEGIGRIIKKEGPSLSAEFISEIRVGTTICTNALLERKGSKVGLLITAGFEDLIDIGDQTRPDIFSLWVEKPDQLYQSVFGIRERINADGRIETPLETLDIERALDYFKKQKIETVVILFMHAWKTPAHEEQAADIVRTNGYSNVICSHEVLPLIKMVTRGQTTLVEAYLSPLFRVYISTLKAKAKSIPLYFMMSSGGLMDSDKVRARDSILSGPAGGVVATAAISDLLGIEEAVGFDMGGTSTDVCRYDGELHRIDEIKLAGIKYQTDQLDVETVAAGGGSILGFDGKKITVGPESAGANPGPVCYGRGGPLTVTDANLILGRLLPENMPKSFGDTGFQVLDRSAAEHEFIELRAEINRQTDRRFIPQEVAEGFISVANETMARAIRRISVAKGYDIRSHALICFGGAAAQHACSIARSLGIEKIIVHPLAGILSAYGIAMAEKMSRKAMAIMEVMTEDLMIQLDEKFAQLENEISGRQSPLDRDSTRFNRFLDLRPLGSDTYLTISVRGSLEVEILEAQFTEIYKKRFGFWPEKGAIEVVNIRTEASTEDPRGIEEKPLEMEYTSLKPEPARTTAVFFWGVWVKTPVFERKNLWPGCVLAGPAIIVDDFTTIFVEPDFECSVNKYGHLELNALIIQKSEATTEEDPVLLEVFNHRFMGIAEQMGYTLANAAHSVNMKERLDFSCAIFDNQGDLVANAPHIPVHLGAMGDSVKSILAEGEDMEKDDVFLINNPHNGGSHLPDVTAVSPVFINNELVFFVATRGHHADIGGIAPGSMPANAKTLEEEGVVIDKFLLVRAGKFHENEITDLLTGGRYPARNIPERISDLRAQCAANARGMQALEELADEMSLDVVRAYMQHIQNNAAEAMEEAFYTILGNENEVTKSFKDYLDDGSILCVEVRITKNRSGCKAVIDFTGTGTELEGNLNAPVSVVKSAVLYVLRMLINRNIPLNVGCFRPVELIIPEGSFLNPSNKAAVAGGNVETSQRIVDVLLGALGIAAASQGTMNNFTFGDPDGKGMQYYETIAGGSGAAEGHPGASAVQVHMTNTRITDPEVIEHRFPNLRIDRFAIRKGSGGEGKWNGGDGSVRAVRFMEQTKVSLLTERRKYQPYGMAGGEPGKSGKNIFIEVDGKETVLNGKEEIVVKENESIIIKTPGGGGFGKL